MKILHLLASGAFGGIETLFRAYMHKSKEENSAFFLFEEGEIYEDLKNEGYEIKSIKNEGILQKVNIINKFCKKYKIDIIIMHHGGLACNIIYILLKKLNPTLKFVRYIHACYDDFAFGKTKNKIKNKIIDSVMKKTLKISDLTIFISKAAKNSFALKFKNIGKKNVIIYNGIDERFFRNNISKKISKEKNNTKIIYVGRLDKTKGVDILIEAFSKINNSVNLTLDIVGDGKERNNLENLCKEKCIENGVNFYGKQNNVEKYLDNADIFVYPSICEEGFGISVVEAMARGLIVITFNKGGLPEIIKDNYNGFIANNTEIEDLAYTISKVIKKLNIEEKQIIIENAIKTAEKFSINNTVENIRVELNKLYKDSKEKQND